MKHALAGYSCMDAPDPGLAVAWIAILGIVIVIAVAVALICKTGQGDD